MIVASLGSSRYFLNPKSCVMSVLAGKAITRKKSELLIVEPSQLLFKVVVNNYKQQEQTLEDNIEETGETMMDDHQGLPPQPTEYIKFPTYDWF